MLSPDLVAAVRSMRPFVPARDFAVSKRFYADIGFTIEDLGDDLAALRLGSAGFLLQNYFVADWAGNFVMHLLVSRLDDWWLHLESLNLATRYGVTAPTSPKLEPWGLRVAYVVDPSGVLWHFAEAV